MLEPRNKEPEMAHRRVHSTGRIWAPSTSTSGKEAYAPSLWGQLTDCTHSSFFRTVSGPALRQHSVADINEEILLFCFCLAAIHSFPILL
jgi:hypothetical protein